MKHTLADIVTAMNLIAGVLAIYATLIGDFTAAIALIAAAVLFDIFDGPISRLYGSGSAFGKEFDSLADVISFGIAPSVFALVRFELSAIVLCVVVLYTLAGAYRLARFNISTIQHFEGLPIPAAACIVLAASYIPLPIWGFAAFIILLAALMVSTIPIKKYGRTTKTDVHRRR